MDQREEQARAVSLMHDQPQHEQLTCRWRSFAVSRPSDRYTLAAAEHSLSAALGGAVSRQHWKGGPEGYADQSA